MVVLRVVPVRSRLKEMTGREGLVRLVGMECTVKDVHRRVLYHDNDLPPQRMVFWYNERPRTWNVALKASAGRDEQDSF